MKFSMVTYLKNNPQNLWINISIDLRIALALIRIFLPIQLDYIELE